MSDSEEWRRVVGHPNYMVSSEGRVKSIDRACMTPGGWLLPRRGVELKPWLIKSTGYLQVGLDNIKRESVHRLVRSPSAQGMRMDLSSTISMASRQTTERQIWSGSLTPTT